MSIYTRYGAVNSKIRYMYGKRLTREDYKSLISMKNVGDIVMYLQKKTSYANVINDFKFEYLNRDRLEQLIKSKILEEIASLMNFFCVFDKEMFKFILYRKEINEILHYARESDSTQKGLILFRIPKSLKNNTLFDWNLLEKENSVENFFNAVREPSYKKVIAAANDYNSLEIALNNALYGDFFKKINKNYSGRAQRLLEQSIGTNIDMINIMRILRIKKYFSMNPDELHKYIIPFYYKLKKNSVNELIKAENFGKTLAILNSSSYGKFFTSIDVDGGEYFENIYEKYLFESNHSVFINSELSINIPFAYFSLKEIEITNLTRIIEGVRYSRQPKEITDLLIGGLS